MPVLSSQGTSLHTSFFQALQLKDASQPKSKTNNTNTSGKTFSLENGTLRSNQRRRVKLSTFGVRSSHQARTAACSVRRLRSECVGTRAPLLPAASPGGRHRARTSRAPPARLERPRRTAGRGTSGCASPLARCRASEPACASLRSGGPRGEGELGSTPEGDGLASSELAGPRGGRTGPGSVGQRGRAARCAGLAAATGPAAHSRAHAARK